MKLAEGIRTQGFRKWYERELIRSHAYLVLTFFCAVGVFATLGGAPEVAGWAERLFDWVGLLLCAVTGTWSLRHYLGRLAGAEGAASQAVCSECTTYGRLELVESDATGSEVRVRCRKCGHGWHISG